MRTGFAKLYAQQRASRRRAQRHRVRHHRDRHAARHAHQAQTADQQAVQLQIAAATDAAMGALTGAELINAVKSAVTNPISPWHYGAYGFLVGITDVSWIYNLVQTGRLDNINKKQTVGMAAQSAVTVGLSAVVVGGLAIPSLLAAIPGVVSAVNFTLAAKSCFDALHAGHHARKLKKAGRGNTVAYKRYVARRKHHFKVAGALTASAAAMLIIGTIPPLAVAASVAMTGLSVAQTAKKIKLAIQLKRQKRKDIEKYFTRRQDGPTVIEQNEAVVSPEPEPAVRPAIVRERVEVQMNEVEAWKQQVARRQQRAGVRVYDRRLNYVEHLKSEVLPKAGTLRNAKQQMVHYVLGVLTSANIEYDVKVRTGRGVSLFTAPQVRRKRDLCAALITRLRENAELSVRDLHQLVAEHSAGQFARGTLASWSKRIGHMQTVIEAVEFYAAFCDESTVPGNNSVEHAWALAEQNPFVRYQSGDEYSLKVSPKPAKQADRVKPIVDTHFVRACGDMISADWDPGSMAP